MRIAERIDQAIAVRADAFGEVPYDILALAVFPRDEYPRAWNYSSNGGPPGCYMALSSAIRRYGFRQSFRGGPQPHIGPRSTTTQEAGE